MLNLNSNTNKQSAGFITESDGLHAITVTATCRKNQDLRIEIDGRSFRELNPEKYVQKFNVPAAFNGAKLRGKLQTNIFILRLDKGQHVLNFITRNGTEISNWETRKIDDPYKVTFDLDLQANSYNCQPLLNFILVDLPLQSISANISIDWHRKSFFRGDGDDVKLVIDNEIITHNQSQWLWKATMEQGSTGLMTKRKVIATNLPYDTHYIEFIADQSPIIHQVVLSLEGSSVIDRVIYPQVFDGDYELHATTRSTEKEKNKAMLAVYILSGNSGEINNDNIELYFNNQKLRLGINAEASKYETVFDFSGRHIEAGRWFFYGIDGSWRWIPPKLDWQNDQNWKIIKKQKSD